MEISKEAQKTEPDEKGAGSLERTELYSFALIVFSMILALALLLPSYYWIFLFLAIIDGISTRYNIGVLLGLDRLAFAFILLSSSATILHFGIVDIIIETLILIALIDFSFYLRQIRLNYLKHGDLWRILETRLLSYAYSLLPSGVISIGVIFLFSTLVLAQPISETIINPSSGIVEFGLASIAVFVVAFLVVRLILTAESDQNHKVTSEQV